MEEGEPLAWLHTNDRSLLAAAKDRFTAALRWGEEKPAVQPLIYDIVR